MKKVSYPIWLVQFILIICLLGGTSALAAENIYVTGVTEITMRTGPGTSHKIVLMLKSGTKLEVVELNDDWSQVRTIGGREGWVLSRFLTKKVPDALLVEKLNLENSRLADRLSTVEEENRELTIKNAALVQIEEKYNKLKSESKQFLELEARHKEIKAQFESQKQTIEKLENDSNREIKYWYMAGPGVLIVGFIFGLGTRKKKKSSLL